MNDEACCTCAKLLSDIAPQYDERTEKLTAQNRRLECCERVICGNCVTVCCPYWPRTSSANDLVQKNPRFAFYCTLTSNPSKILMLIACLGPFCQVSSKPSSLPQGFRDPPAYSPPASPKLNDHTLPSSRDGDEPPAYSTVNPLKPPKEKDSEPPAEDVLHFLDPSQDTIPSLALRYRVPQDALRRKNGLFADHLLAARKTILISGEFYKGGVSLSPKPLESEEEEIKKAKIRRWMVACKVAE